MNTSHEPTKSVLRLRTATITHLHHRWQFVLHADADRLGDGNVTQPTNAERTTNCANGVGQRARAKTKESVTTKEIKTGENF